MRPWLYVCLVALLVGCKSQGSIDITLDFPSECSDDATHAQVYYLHGGTCAEAGELCGDSLLTCTNDNCTAGCAGGYCAIDDFDRGLSNTPPKSGSYAIVYQLLQENAEGLIELIATACVDGVQLDKDGTTDSSFEAPGVCCGRTN